MIISTNKKLLLTSIVLSLSLIGCDSKVSVSTTKTSSSDSQSTAVSSQSSVSVNNDTVTVIEEKSSSFNSIRGSGNGNTNMISIGNDNIVVNDNKAYFNGKELDLDTHNGISLSYDGDKQLINGKPIKFKDGKSVEKPLDIELTLSGENVKVPVNSLTDVNSSFDIEQQCSSSKESYFMVDSVLKPYLVDSHNGTLRLKEGKYTIKGRGKLVATLFTPALNSFNFNSSGSITLSCIDKKSFNLENEGIGSVTVNNLSTDVVHISQSGVGHVLLNGDSVNQLYATNSGVGTLKFNVPINEGHIENSGVGNISAKQINQLDAINSGIGNIDVSKSDKTLRSENSSMGHINVNKQD